MGTATLLLAKLAGCTVIATTRFADKAPALKKLGAEIPNLPAYDSTKAEKLPWEDELTAAIQKLQTKQKPDKHKRQKRSTRRKHRGL